MVEVEVGIEPGPTGVLGWVMPLARLATDIYPKFFLDGLHHLAGCIEAGQSMNNEGFDLAS